MNALILTDLCIDDAGSQLLRELRRTLEERGWRVDTADLTQLETRPCLVCDHCGLKRPGECVQRDDFSEVFASIPAHDMLVLAGASRFGTWRPTLKLAIDRFLPLLVGFYTRRHGELHHQQRYAKPTRLLGVGWVPSGREDEAAMLTRLVGRHGRNWAVEAWAEAVGSTPEAVLEALPAALDSLEAA
jgi:hypothetical protein